LAGNVGIGATTTPNNLIQVYDLIDFNNTDKNSKLGYQAGKNIVSGAVYNTFLGYQAGFSSSTGSTNAADGNVGVGYQSLYSNTSGANNAAVGHQALFSNTSGYDNTAVGLVSLYSNTAGHDNTAAGYYSLYANTTGSSNTAMGMHSLRYNTTGVNNTAAGYYSLRANTEGYNNAAFGYSALAANTTGTANTAMGVDALYYNTTGTNNTAMGYYSLFNNTGDNNTAIGYTALRQNTSGYQNTASGVNSLYSNTAGYFNTASGVNSLDSNTTGHRNTAIGYRSLSSNTEGYRNTAIGTDSLYSNTTAIYNTAVGFNALYSNTTGTNNTANGVNSLVYNATGTGNAALGYYAGAYETGSDSFYVNNRDRTNTAGDKTKSLLYGTFAAATTSQQLTVNGALNVAGTLTVAGSPVGGSGGNYWTQAGSYLYASSTAWNVGIGTATPGDNLQVASTNNAKGITLSGSVDNPALNFAGTGTGAKNWWIGSTAGTSGFGTGKLVFVDQTDLAATPVLTLASTGNVGIGTTGPDEKLTLFDGYLRLQRVADAYSGTYLANKTGTNEFLIGVGGKPTYSSGYKITPDGTGAVMMLANTGSWNWYVNSGLTADTLSVALTPKMALSETALTVEGEIIGSGVASVLKLYDRANGASHAFGWYTTGNTGRLYSWGKPGDIITAAESGNVGIGTTGSPGYRLDVQGGQINSSGGLCIAGDCKTAWSQVGSGSTDISVFGSGVDGDVIISSNTTLTRDMVYNNLTVNSGYNLYPNGYRIFVKDTLTNNGTISVRGNNAVSNTPGAATAAGYLGEGKGGGGTTGQPGGNAISSFGGNGGAGYRSGSGTTGAGGTTAVPPATSGTFKVLPAAVYLV
jgi:hypothetical protein